MSKAEDYLKQQLADAKTTQAKPELTVTQQQVAEKRVIALEILVKDAEDNKNK